MNLETSYKSWFEQLKSKIQSAQLKAAIAVNSQLLQLYWDLGKEIVVKQRVAKWGDAVLEQLSLDLRLSFPAISGFSKRNLYAIRQWYLFYSARFEFVPQPVAQIPWGHNRLIISKIKDLDEAIFYAVETTKQGWSRDQLEFQIKVNYFRSKGNGLSNFSETLPSHQSQLAKETIKNPYKPKTKLKQSMRFGTYKSPSGLANICLLRRYPKISKTICPLLHSWKIN